MRLFLLLLNIVLKISCNSYVKGVSKSMQAYYANHNDIFKCLDHTKTIPYRYMNDDYCDCADGSDEPGTNACNNGIFWCRNVGYREKSIASMYVNDDICGFKFLKSDCCDGSDESFKVCENTCFKLAEDERRKRQEKIDIITEGKQKLDAFKANHDNFLNDMQIRLKELEQQYLELKISHQNIGSQQNETHENIEKLKLEIQESWIESVKVKYAENIFRLVDENNDSLIDTTESENTHLLDHYNISAMRSILKDGPISIADFIKLWIIEPEIHLNEIDSEPDETEYPTESNLDDEKDDIDYGEDGVLITKNDSTEPKENVESHQRQDHHHHHRSLYSNFKRFEDEFLQSLKNPTSEALQTLQAQHREATDMLNRLSKDLSSNRDEFKFLQAYDSLDFGPNKAFEYLFRTCVEKHINSYTYKICPFFRGTQTTRYDEHIIGKWSHWSPDSEPFTKMIFDNGDNCYDNSKRSFEITFDCYKENVIDTIEEIRSCRYHVHLLTPAACSTTEIPDINDEL